MSSKIIGLYVNFMNFLKRRLCKYIEWKEMFKGKCLWERHKEKFKNVGENTMIEWPFKFEGEKYITIGKNTHCCWGSRIRAWDNFAGGNYTPELIIGDNVSINHNVDIACNNKIIIGNGVGIASNVLITDHNHGNLSQSEKGIPPHRRILYSKGPVIIKDNAWIGINVTILPGVTIGENAIIASNAVVNKDVPANTIAGGIPAKVIKEW